MLMLLLACGENCDKEPEGVDLTGVWTFQGTCPYYADVLMELDLKSDGCGNTGTFSQKLGDGPGTVYDVVTSEAELVDLGGGSYELNAVCSDFHRLDEQGEVIDPGCYHVSDGVLPLQLVEGGLVAEEGEWGCGFTLVRE